MKIALVASLAWQDYRADARVSACMVLALVAVIAPLLVMFGLKFGLVSSLTERLERDPSVRELIPMGGGRFSAAFIGQLALRPDVAFALPRTRQIASTAELASPGQERKVNVEMIPTAAGDPLVGDITPVTRIDHILLSKTAAEKLGVRAGDWLDATFARQMGGRVQSQNIGLQVATVMSLEAFGRDGMFVSLALLEAVEDYRDGRAVEAFGWAGDVSQADTERVFPAFRLYARNLDDVEPLRRYFADQHLLVSTKAQAISQVRSLSRNLSIVFWVIAALAVVGAVAAVFASALAAIERKRRELSVLRLLGLTTGALLLFVVLQASYSGVLATLVSIGLYHLAERCLNHLFVQGPDEYASLLLSGHFLVAAVAVLVASASAAALGGWRVAGIEASEGIRDV